MSTWQKRIVAGLGVTGALCFAMALVYVVASLRLCFEQSRIRRDDFVFGFCYMSNELIAAVPVNAPSATPLYSWRYANGTKPTLIWLSYPSRHAPSEASKHLRDFLKQQDFQRREPPLYEDADSEWWSREHDIVVFWIEPNVDSPTVQVNVVHNQGLN